MVRTEVVEMLREEPRSPVTLPSWIVHPENCDATDPALQGMRVGFRVSLHEIRRRLDLG